MVELVLANEWAILAEFFGGKIFWSFCKWLEMKGIFFGAVTVCPLRWEDHISRNDGIMEDRIMFRKQVKFSFGQLVWISMFPPAQQT